MGVGRNGRGGGREQGSEEVVGAGVGVAGTAGREEAVEAKRIRRNLRGCMSLGDYLLDVSFGVVYEE